MKWQRSPAVNASIGILVILSAAIYLLCNYYLHSLGRELMMNWARSEATAIQEGNLLTSVTKAQPYLMSSDYVNGVSLLKTGTAGVSSEISFGKQFEVSEAEFIDLSDRPAIHEVGFLHSQALYRIPGRSDLVMVFNLKSKLLDFVFFGSVAFLTSVLVGLIFLLRWIESREVKKREKLLKLALSDLVFKDAASETLDQEFPEVSSWWRKKKDELMAANRAAIENQSKILLGEMASRLAHDITGSVRNIEILTRRMTGLDEINLNHLKSSIKKISDLASGVSAMTKESMAAEVSQKRNVDVSEILARVVDEKVHVFGDVRGLNFQFLSVDTQLLCYVDPLELERSVGNLITNAAEACARGGFVHVEARKTGSKKLEILITDSGVGISDRNLQKIGMKGFTEGKGRRGTGLGVYCAKKMFEEGGGTFSIRSELGIGTSVRIVLPLINESAVLENGLTIKRGSTIAVLDDSEVVRGAMALKFKSQLEDPNNELKLVCFSTADAFKEWISVPSNRSVAFPLIDFFLEDQFENGLEVIEASSIEDRAILVTSAPSDNKVREHANRLGVPILGKEEFFDARFAIV